MTQQTEFIPYEQALELRQLGFKEECLGEWQNLKSGKNLVVDEECDRIFDVPILGAPINAPLYQQAFRWFREKHNIDGFVQIEPLNELYGFVVYNRTHNRFIEYDRNLSIEQAQLECLKKLIQSVKNK